MTDEGTGRSSGITADVKRRTCNRCRKQKLRCPRSNLENEAPCVRCQRLGVKCEYGNLLPKGRPSSRRPRVHSEDNKSCTHQPSSSHSNSAENDTPLGGERHLQESDWEWIWELPPLDTFIDDLTIEPVEDSAPNSHDQTSIAEDRSADRSVHHLSGSLTSRPPKVYPPRADSTGKCIQQLSDLNARLYPVHKVCRAIDTGQHQYNGPVITEAAFETIPALVEGPNGVEPPLAGKCNVLYEILCASRRLVNIVSPLLHRDDIPDTALKGLEHLEEPADDIDVESSEEPPASSDVVYYLILGCYTRILQLYGSLIKGFHHDASNAMNAQNGFQLSPISSTELRLVLLVHLVSRLIKRLRTVHAQYFSQIERSSTTESIESNIVKHRAGLEKISLLEHGLERKLDHLQLVLQS